MQRTDLNPYATLGLHERCTAAQIRAAYRLLARQHHPDVNPGSRDALAQTQALNAAYEILSDPARRSTYDDSRQTVKQTTGPVRAGKTIVNVSQDVHLRLEDFLRGVTLEVRVHDPGNPNGPETYPLVIPPETAPGAKFRLPRSAPFERGFVLVRARVRPNPRFKARGSDLRCDLRITCQRAAQGGMEMVASATGARLRVQIPKGAERGEIIRLAGEGLPKPRGGRGDLLVRLSYRPEVRITRA